MTPTPVSHSFLQPGARPLFAARKLAEAIERQARKGSPWAAATRAQTLGWICALRSLSELLSRRGAEGAARADQASLKALLGLPLVFPPELARAWESQRPWSDPSYQLDPDARLAYGALLDSERPSEAYQVKSSDWRDPSFKVWRAWLDNESDHQLRLVFEASAHALEEWESRRPASPCPLESNIAHLSARLGISPASARAWIALETLGGMAPQEAQDVWDLAREETSSAEDFFWLWESAIGLERGSMAALAAPGGELERLRFCKGTALWAPMLAYEKGAWAERWRAWTFNQRGRFELRSPRKDADGALAAFLRPCPAPKLGLDAWKHLDPLPSRLLAALRSEAPARILLWGEPGSGKTELALALCAAAERSAWEPLWPSPDAERAAERGITAASQAEIMASALGKSALIFDECERVWGAAGGKTACIELLGSSGCHQIWIANSVEGCDPALLRRFDAIHQATEMPRSARHELALTLFKDADIAFRVAQAFKTPAGVEGAARWCRAAQDFSWGSVCSYLSGHAIATQAAAQKGARPSFPLVSEDDAALPPMAGNPDLAELKERLSDAMLHPQRYKALGAAMPKGVLLIGPPGTGKTLFARHLARAIGAPMIAPDSAQLAAHPSQIKELFHEARRLAPCLIFLDEADALLASPLEAGGINSAKQQIVNSFLAELDGVSSMEGVLVVAATHRNPDFLEPAALRAGRLGETLTLSHPTESSREAIWSAHLSRKPVDPAVDCALLARDSCGFSGAEIAEAINRAALSCARQRLERLSPASLAQACDDVYWGAADSSMAVSDHERWLTAVHEAGHAMIAWKNSLRVPRVTARPRSKFMGATQWTPEEGSHSMALSDLLGRVEMTLGGIAAEKALFGEFADGGSGDLEMARKLIDTGHTRVGFGASLPTTSGGDRLLWSNERRRKVEQEEEAQMADLFASATEWLLARSELLEAFARDILQRKELSGSELSNWAARVKASFGEPVADGAPPAERRSSSEASHTLHAGSPPRADS